MTVSNFYWTLEEEPEGFSLQLISTGEALRSLTLDEVRALAAIAELANSKPSGGLTATVGMKTKVEVKKYG